MDENGILTLCDDEGNEMQLEFADLIIHKNDEYAVFFNTDGSDDVVIFKVGEDISDDTVTYEPVENEKTLNDVFRIFKDRYNENN